MIGSAIVYLSLIQIIVAKQTHFQQAMQNGDVLNRTLLKAQITKFKTFIAGWFSPKKKSVHDLQYVVFSECSWKAESTVSLFIYFF